MQATHSNLDNEDSIFPPTNKTVRLHKQISINIKTSLSNILGKDEKLTNGNDINHRLDSSTESATPATSINGRISPVAPAIQAVLLETPNNSPISTKKVTSSLVFQTSNYIVSYCIF